jgi:hypothetical protein
MIVAVIALIVALSGTAIARVLITSSSQIAPGAVNGSDVANHTISIKDLAQGAISKLGSDSTEVFHAETRDLPGLSYAKLATLKRLARTKKGERYLLLASADLYYTNNQYPVRRSECDLRRGDGPTLAYSTSATNSGIGQSHVLTDVGAFPAPASVTLRCIVDSPGTFDAFNARIVAIKVGD